MKTVIEMAREAGKFEGEADAWNTAPLVEYLGRFAALVRADEREQRPWVGLTDEEVLKIIDAEIGFNSCWGPEEAFARAIEAKLKEKNNAV